MDVDGLRPLLTMLFSLCALSALMGSLMDDNRFTEGARAVCGLSLALIILKLATRLLVA